MPGEAERVIGDLQARIADTERRVAGREPASVLLVYPGMAMMNAHGLPAVYAGGIYDDVIRRAGGINVFEGANLVSAAAVNEEQLAAAEVDLLVIGQFRADEDVAAEAQRLFDRFPEWRASATQTWTTVSDGPEVGPTNPWAVERIARAAHPGAF